MLKGGINGRKRSFGKLTTPIGDFDWLGAQSNYMVSTLKDPTMLRWPRCKTRQHPKYAKRMQKVCKIYSNVCKMYANSMQKICKNDAKSIQNLCKKDTVMHCTIIWHLALGTWHLALGTWHLALGTWHLALGTWYLALDCLNGKKNSNSYCSSEGKNRPDKKSTASSQKKFG